MSKKRKGGLISRNRSKRTGLPPGTLTKSEEPNKTAVNIQVIQFSEQYYDEYKITGLGELKNPASDNVLTWLNVEGIHDIQIVEQIGSKYGIHPLTLEDITNTDQRPKFESYDFYDVFMMKMLYYENELQSEQLTVVLLDKMVISFQEEHGGDAFGIIRERLRMGKGRVRKMGEDYLAYALLDAVVDIYFNILEKIGDKIESIDEQLVKDPEPEMLVSLHDLKREMIYLRKAVWPVREVFTGFERSGSPRLKESTEVYLRDAQDHSIRVIETVENFRDLLAGMIDIYLSGLSHKMNEVVKVLTIISTIFIPVTFIAGVYGMNFEYMPELRSPYGYAVTWIIMLAVMISLMVYFRRKKWL